MILWCPVMVLYFYAVYRWKERGAECQLSEVCPNLDDFACYSKILSMDEKLLFIS